MSLVKSKAIQLGFDATPTNNFLIYQPLTPDGTFRIANGNQGATTDIMTVTSGGSVTFAGTTNFSSLNFGAGTESAPSLFPTGDSNTGIWFPAADTFAVSTGGTQRLRINSTGALGVGGTNNNNPAVQVWTGSFNYGVEVMASTGGTNNGVASLRLLNSANTVERFGVYSVSDSETRIFGSGKLGVYTNGTNRLSISSVGLVGIGIEPVTNLHVFASTSNNILRLQSGTTTNAETNRIQFYNASGAADSRSGSIEWFDNGTFKGDIRLLKAGGLTVRNSSDAETFYIDNSGNVGINTSAVGTPGSKLHVYGGNIHVGGYNNGTTEYGITLSPKDAGVWKWMGLVAGSSFQIGAGTVVGTSPQLTLDINGSLGIGITPSHKAQVHKEVATGNVAGNIIAVSTTDGSGSASFGYGMYVSNTNQTIGEIRALYRDSANGGRGMMTIGTVDYQNGVSPKIVLSNRHVGIGTVASEDSIPAMLTVSDPYGAANGSPAEIVRIANPTANSTSSYITISSTAGTDWKVGKNPIGTSGVYNFQITDTSNNVYLDANPTAGYVKTATKFYPAGGLYATKTTILSGTYSAGSWYEIASSWTLESGMYVIHAFLETHAVGGAFYYWDATSVPFYFNGTSTNSTSTFTFPAFMGAGHANGGDSFSVRIRLTSNTDGRIFIEFSPGSTWSGLDGSTYGKNVRFYFRRMG